MNVTRGGSHSLPGRNADVIDLESIQLELAFDGNDKSYKGHLEENADIDGVGVPDSLALEKLSATVELPGPSKDERRSSSIDHFIEDGKLQNEIEDGSSSSVSSVGEDGRALLSEQPRREKEKPVQWMSLPRKDQLIILTLVRLAEPLTATSLQSYMFYQLKSFDPKLPDSTISIQAGILQGSFTAAQFVTAILWGRVADAEWGGRKRVIMVGLLGTLVSCVGFGFSKSFVQAVLFRSMGGALNGNIGVMRTMISEIIKEKKYQSRAFLMLPITFNIGVIIGPILGGVLADPVTTYPNIFGPGSLIGGEHGVGWMVKWPYALPNLLSAIFLFWSALGCFLGLEETLESRQDRTDYGLRLGRFLVNLFRRCMCRRVVHGYSSVASDETGTRDGDATDLELQSPAIRSPMTKLSHKLKQRPKLPFRRLFTSNVLFTLLAHALLALHVGTFNSLWFVFLSTPRFNPKIPEPSGHQQRLPFSFTGGLGLPPPSIGLVLAILGVIGITIQLLVYPTVIFKLGTVKSYRMALLFFPVTYALAPFLAVVPSKSAPPHEADGALLWLAMAGVLFIQVIARTFALPATTILINNCTPHPSVLGTVHGIGTSVSAFVRAIGPVLFGWVYGLSLNKGTVGLAWWILSSIAIFGFVSSYWLYEGNGHEIVLEGDDAE